MVDYKFARKMRGPMLKNSVIGILAAATILIANAHASVTVMFSYADWCAPCQILRPKLEAALDRLDDDDIEVIYLDFTETSVENFDAQFAKTPPLSPEFFTIGNFVKTGFAYVLDGGEIIAELRVEMSEDDIANALTVSDRS